MKNIKQVSMLILMMAMTLTPMAFGEVIKGYVSDLDHGERSISLIRTDPGIGAGKEFEILVRPGTEFKGVRSLSELNLGDTIRVDASANSQDGYEAASIEKADGSTTSQIIPQEDLSVLPNDPGKAR